MLANNVRENNESLLDLVGRATKRVLVNTINEKDDILHAPESKEELREFHGMLDSVLVARVNQKFVIEGEHDEN